MHRAVGDRPLVLQILHYLLSVLSELPGEERALELEICRVDLFGYGIALSHHDVGLRFRLLLRHRPARTSSA